MKELVNGIIERCKEYKIYYKINGNKIELWVNTERQRNIMAYLPEYFNVPDNDGIKLLGGYFSNSSNARIYTNIVGKMSKNAIFTTKLIVIMYIGQDIRDKTDKIFNFRDQRVESINLDRFMRDLFRDSVKKIAISSYSVKANEEVSNIANIIQYHMNRLFATRVYNYNAIDNGYKNIRIYQTKADGSITTIGRVAVIQRN